VFVIINASKHTGKVVIKISQGSAVTQTVVGGITRPTSKLIYNPVADFLYCR